MNRLRGMADTSMCLRYNNILSVISWKPCFVWRL